MARVLILDDETHVLAVLQELMVSMGHEPVCCSSLDKGVRIAREQIFDLIFLDLDFPNGNGLDVLPTLVHAPYSPQVLIITGAGTRNAAEIAFRHGAWDFVRKPFNLGEVKVYTSRALQYRDERLASAAPRFLKRDSIIGSSPVLQSCLEELARAAFGDASVLITGETGVGKELFARALQENSPRSSQPMIVADCGAIPETLAESIFFGHEKGAFTGAGQARQGLIKQAHGGTLFLDEIGEMPLALQTRLLRVLQERRFRPIGSHQEVESDFRLVAATNQDVDLMVREGRLRQDLLFRIRAIQIRLPPLRERKEDIPALVTHHLVRLGKLYGTDIKGVSAEFLNALLVYDWPGNVRELVHAVERAFSAAMDTGTIHPFHLPPEIRARSVFQGLEKEPGKPGMNMEPPDLPGMLEFPTLKDYLDAAEKHYLLALMQRVAGRREEAVRLSGLSQSKLYQALKQHAIPGFRGSRT
ncbi:MAG TPA: sigma-54 dependent transcriptional regulator [Syntrophobacteraceae bacterium]|nr:sigma-54 dependent transcriptional regulator [Syntrophobacteraceae bacterium]